MICFRKHEERKNWLGFFFFWTGGLMLLSLFWGLEGGTRGKCIREDKEKKRIRSKVESVSQKSKKRKE